MKKREPVIRVIMLQRDRVDSSLGMFLEQLRYMGYLKMHYTDRRTDDTPTHTCCFDIYPPRDRNLDVEQWCKMNAERMRSFGYNAIVAPRWSDPE